ncbi:MAG: NAD(P)/FAD-dependent oxidoreductase [Betaproteobacteria bacterium]|nr:NAD(P)/FAD-dependent oxidoreductase [Betaproteobacteria bacterium]
MLRLTELKLPLDHSDDALRAAIVDRLNIDVDDVLRYNVYRRAVDARKRSAIQLTYTLDVEVADESALLSKNKNINKIKCLCKSPDTGYRYVARAPQRFENRPLVIGSGPCGLFAGLLLAQMGFRPLIVERGKVVRERTQDTWGLWRRSQLNPESNVQFGEGGAGTFSDGKLYSQIKDARFLGRKVLTEFVKAGAPEEILYVAKPHIGTFRLVGVVEAMRATIESLGGEFRFQSRVVDLIIEQRQVRGVVLSNGEIINADHVVLAVGHSARDTFQMLHERGVYIEAKPFSIGFRIEHPQSLIDRVRWGNFAGHKLLGAADYKLVHHCNNGRSVYSFCMCPGGTVVAATSEAERVVTNGMSQYSRNERNANAGIVVGITPDKDYSGHVLAGIDFQRRWESAAFVAGGGDYRAPAQRVGDFLAGRASSALGSVMPSYQPGVRMTDLSACVPDFVIAAIREALPAFDRQIKGFAMDDALLTGVETRTSSPIRIKRNAMYQSLNTRGLYPAGEGAGYAGGILSAAVDGIEVAEAVAVSLVAQEKRQ